MKVPYYAALTYLYKLSEKSFILPGAVFFILYDDYSVKVQIKKIKDKILKEKCIYIDGSATIYKIPQDIIPFVTVGDRQEELEGYKREYLENGQEKTIDGFVEFCKMRFCVTTL